MKDDKKMNNKVLFIMLFVAIFGAVHSFAQNVSPQDMERLHIMEDSMLLTSDSMYDAMIPDTRIGYSERFVRQLVKALKIPASYYFPFDKLKEKINIIYADDNGFRVFNWCITPSNIMKRYYGAVQLPSMQLKLYGLLDYTEEVGKGAEDSVLTNGKWFGALYYRIMATETDNGKIYTLFGLNASNPISNRKVLDVLTISDHGITFGAPVFGVVSRNFPQQRVNRFILEYKKNVQVSMNWDKERNLIVFDKLVSQVNDPNRKYTYVPSGQYDGFRWSAGMWNYLQDIIPVTLSKDGVQPAQDVK